jgi:hypothetical protein
MLYAVCSMLYAEAGQRVHAARLVELREHRPAADQRRPIPLEWRRLDECVQVEVERKVEIDHERTARYDRKPIRICHRQPSAEPARPRALLRPKCESVSAGSRVGRGENSLSSAAVTTSPYMKWPRQRDRTRRSRCVSTVSRPTAASVLRVGQRRCEYCE